MRNIGVATGATLPELFDRVKLPHAVEWRMLWQLSHSHKRCIGIAGLRHRTSARRSFGLFAGGDPEASRRFAATGKDSPIHPG